MKHGTIRVIAVVAVIGCYEIFLAATGGQITQAPDEDSALSMLQGGANPNGLGKFGIQGYTPLQYAAKCNWTRLIDALLKKGVDVNAGSPSGPVTALQVAARFGNAEAAEHLLKAGANPNAHNEHQESALIMAAEAEVPDDYGYLVPNNAKIQNYAKIIKLLVAAGADVAAKDYAGHTASDIVLMNRNASFMEESLLALKASKPSDKVDAISYKQIAAILTSVNNKHFSSLSILLKSSDPDVRTRALEVLDDIAVSFPSSRNNDDDWDWDMYMRQSHIEGSAHSPSYLARNLFDRVRPMIPVVE